jgi:hypothetical protein
MNQRARAEALTRHPSAKGGVLSVTGPHGNRLVTAFTANPERQA